MVKQGLNSNGEELSCVFVEKQERYATRVGKDGRTRQEFRDECDINVLMATYERNGVLPPMNRGTPQYLDVSDVPDLQEAIAVMDAAQSAFMRLPATVRKEFDNDAVKFVEFAQNPSNLDSMRKWGLAPPAQAPTAVISEPPLPLQQDAPKTP